MEKDTIKNIPTGNDIGQGYASPPNHKHLTTLSAKLSGAYIYPAGNSICPICHRQMWWDRTAQAFDCRNRKCKPGLKFDWAIPEGKEPKHLKDAITRHEYERQVINHK